MSTSPDATNGTVPRLEARGVSVRFGGVEAVSAVDLKVFAGRVVCLLGDNGAGKSTLVRVLTGVVRPQAGCVLFDGEVRTDWSPRVARRLGVETVFQDKALAENQQLARNVFMGRELVNRLGFIRLKAQETRTAEMLQEIGFRSRVLSTRSRVRSLSGGEREGLAIGRASLFGSSVLVLDEPTTGLSLSQTQHVLDLISAATSKGLGLIFISHSMSDAYAVGDSFVILDRGRVVARFDKANIDLTELVEFMQSSARR